MSIAAIGNPCDTIRLVRACDSLGNAGLARACDCGWLSALVRAMEVAASPTPQPARAWRLPWDVMSQDDVGPHGRAAHRPQNVASAGGTGLFLVGLLVLILTAGRWDSAGGGLPVQWAIAAITWAFLLVALWRGPSRYRLPTLALVLVATGFECLGSLIVRAYEYRLHNLPLYVPPGHGLFYLGALRLADLPAVRRHADAVIAAVAALATGWVLYGLTAWALPDLLGALCWLLLLGFLGCGRDPLLFALTFCLTMFLEFYGTAMGIWHWAAILPGTPLPAANPPAAIGAGYCVLDAVAACLVQWVTGTGLRSLPSLPAARVSDGSMTPIALLTLGYPVHWCHEHIGPARRSEWGENGDVHHRDTERARGEAGCLHGRGRRRRRHAGLRYMGVGKGRERREGNRVVHGGAGYPLAGRMSGLAAGFSPASSYRGAG